MIFALLLLFLPIIFLYKGGKKSIDKKGDYVIICILSFLFQIILTFVSFSLAIDSILESGKACATPAVGILPMSFFITLMMIAVISVQVSNHKKRNQDK